MLSAGVMAAIASSLCCITPLVALLGGLSGAASVFSWIEPARPYLMGVSVLALGYAFYQAYRPLPADDCGCDVDQKKSFLNSKGFLWSITFLSAFLFSLPYTSAWFSPKADLQVMQVAGTETTEYTINIEGMTCTGCENHVSSALSSIAGVEYIRADHRTGTASLLMDTSKVSIEHLADVLKDETGYTIIGHKQKKQ